MADLKTARKNIEDEKLAAQRKAREQFNALRGGYQRTDFASAAPRPKKQDEGYKPGPAQTVDQLGGAGDDPNLEITVGPDGVVRRRRK